MIRSKCYDCGMGIGGKDTYKDVKKRKGKRGIEAP